MKILKNFQESDLDNLVKFRNSFFPKNRWWTIDRAKRELLDFGRGYGENVIIEEEDGMINAFAGFVKTPTERGEFYIAPFVIKSSNESVLIDKLISIAKENQAKWIRTSVFSDEGVKKSLLKDHNFCREFDFITCSLNLNHLKFVEKLTTQNLLRIPFAELDPDQFADLNNRAFENVRNAAIINRDQALEVFDSFYSYGKLSQVWRDHLGQYIGFVEITKDGFIEAIAIDPGLHKKGIGKLVLHESLKHAKLERFENIKSIIASDNSSSLALHQSLGFKEIDRVEVMQLDLS